MPAPDNAIAHARERRGAALDDYRAFLAIPSVSTLSEHKPDMRQAAEWLAAALERAGMGGIDTLPTPGHPAVYAERLEAPGALTVLVYGHYDVQPADPIAEWESPPFAPEVRGDYIYARGASDMKGQILAQIKAVEAIAAQGGFPVNIKYLIEGEEEIGSPHLAGLIEAHRERLACDFVLNCDAGIHAPDVPAIIYSLRGLAYFELTLRTAKKDLHSGLFGGSIRNPAHVLCELIAGMHEPGGRVTLPGFYDRVRPLADRERELMARVPHDDAEWLEMAGAKALYGEAGYSTLERVGARPTLEVNGIWGGFTGEGSKTVLPAKASAKISARLVADQRPEEVQEQLRAYIAERLPQEVDWELSEHAWGPGATMALDTPYMQAAAAALRATFGADPLFKREGGSVPVVGMMQEMLGVDSVMLGFALPSDGIHGPNERQYLPNFHRGIETYIRFLMGL